jgi:rhodanese-related sulfurtransferase
MRNAMFVNGRPPSWIAGETHKVQFRLGVARPSRWLSLPGMFRGFPRGGSESATARVLRSTLVMLPICGGFVAFGFVSVIAYLFWRGTVVVVNARHLVEGGAVLLYAGTPAEFSAAHVTGSVNIPASDIARRRGEIPDRKRPIVVYARSGFRSARAAHILRSIGYQRVTNVGPMSRWDGPAEMPGAAAKSTTV